LPPEILLIGLISVLALSIASVTVVLLLAWHRSPPSVSALRADVEALSTSHTDLSDRVHHWFRRESTRKAREKKLKKHDDEDFETVTAVPAATGDRKASLRARLAAARSQ